MMFSTVHQLCAALAAVVALLDPSGPAQADDWPQFRGPAASGIATEKGLPVRWSATEGIAWKAPLPGPGSSSPIVFGDKVLVTCYTGYGIPGGAASDPAALKRHLICFDKRTGKQLWNQAVAATLPEDPYAGYLAEHGYASSTPVTDGERVYVFFGKSGALAFDLQGQKLWQTSLGTSSSNRRWGSGASPVLYKDWVIVNASEESRSIRALDKKTGAVVWTAEAAGAELCYATPLVLEVAPGRTDLVVPVAGEVWGLNADTGKLRWYARVDTAGNVCPSPVAAGGVMYIAGGFNRRSVTAVRAGGEGDVTETHLLWTSAQAPYVPSPVISQGRLMWVSEQGYACCTDAQTGKPVYRERLDAPSNKMPVYASVVLADGRLYATSRTNGTFILGSGPQFEQIAVNKIEDDASDCSASPAISQGRIYLRSQRFLYCLGK
jgi:outer membrane protein assembly factor BamB